MGTAFLRQLQQEFKGYNGQKLAKDLMAGLTVAAVALPLALAFGVSAGATAACGLVTAIVAGLIISALTGGYYQISGPTGAMAAILGSLIATYGMQGMFVATFLAGALLILAAVLHLGNLTAFVPAPVITGFTSGIAVIIAMGQIDNFFGTHSEGASAIAKIISYKDLGFHPDIATTLIALFVVLLMVFFPKKWNAVVPASLIGIIIATAATMILKLDIATVGEIPKTLMLPDRLSPAQIDWNTVPALLAPAFSIAVLNMLESLLCGASAGRATGGRTAQQALEHVQHRDGERRCQQSRNCVPVNLCRRQTIRQHERFRNLADGCYIELQNHRCRSCDDNADERGRYDRVPLFREEHHQQNDKKRDQRGSNIRMKAEILIRDDLRNRTGPF